MTENFETLDVKLPNHQYKILIGAGLLNELALHVGQHITRKKIAIISDETVAGLYLDRVKKIFKIAQINCDTLVLPSGETSKTWHTLSKTVEWLIEQRIERDDIIVAFGGGVIGDLVGFAASIVRRGVSVIQVPTTLLAQVDSSVGGKTGITSTHGKNLIGTFHQPTLVIADTDLLKTLPKRDFLSGYSEVVKYGLLGDAEFFEWLNNNFDSLIEGNVTAVSYAIKRSCQTKAKIVVADEKEKGQRALLNLGHTFGHAIEAAANYSDKILHGEAVSIGCVLAFKFSEELGLCSSEDVQRVLKHFVSVGLKTDFKDIPITLPSAEDFIGLMMNDKKVKNGSLNLILLNKIGDAFLSENVSLNRLQLFLEKQLG